MRRVRQGVVAPLVAAGAVLAVATPAAAGEVLVIEEPWTEEVRCGDVTGTASGTVVQRIQLREERDGGVRFVLTERVEDSTFVTSDGRTYRVVGAGYARGRSEPEFVLQHQLLNLAFIGPSGRLVLHEVYDGTTRTVRGDCTFQGVGDEP